MDKSKALYDKLNEGKLYTKSYDEFVNQFGTPEGQKKLYNALSSQKLYTKSQDDFSNQFWSNAPIAEEVKKKDVTELSGTTDSLGGGFNFEKKANQLKELGITKPTSLSKEDIANPVVNEEYNRQIDEINKKNADKKVLDTVIQFGIAPALDRAGLNKTFAAGISGISKGVLGLLEGGTELLSNYVFTSGEAKKKLDATANDFHDVAIKMGDIDESLIRQQKRDFGFKEEDLDKSGVDLYKEGKMGVGKAMALGGIAFVHSLPQVIVASALTPSTAAGALATRAATFGTTAAMSLGSELVNESEQNGGLDSVGVTKAFFKAGIEGLTESLGMKDIYAAKSLANAFEKPALKALKDLISSEGKDAAKNEIVRSFLGFSKKALGKSVLQETVSGGVQEGLEEVISTAGSFIVDRVADGKWESANYGQLVDNLIEAGLTGAAAGIGMSGIAATASMQKLTDDQKVKISKYSEIYNNTSLSEDIRGIAKKQMEDIVKYNQDLASPVYDNITSLPSDKRADALNLTFKIKSLQDQKSEIKDTDMQDSIDKDIVNLEQQREEIFSQHKEQQATAEQNYTSLITGQKLNVVPDKPYVFTFKNEEDVPVSLKDVKPASELSVNYNHVPHIRYTYSGQSLIDAGLANEQVQAPAATEVQPTQQNEFNPISFDKNLYQDKKSFTIGGVKYEFNRLNTYGEENVFSIEKDGNEIGRATLDEKGNFLTNIRIDENYRRMGLGSKLYDYIEQQANIKLKPSPIKQSKAAENLWEKRLSKQENGQTTSITPAETGITENQKRIINDAVSQVVELKPTEAKGEIAPTQQVQEVATKTPKLPKEQKPKGKPYERALNVEDDSPEASAIKFFAAGGKVMRSLPANYVGAKLKTLETYFSKSKQGKNIVIKSETNSRRSISETKEKGGLSVDQIAHKLWEQNENPRYESGDFLNAVEEVIKNFRNKTQMSNYLLENNGAANKNGLTLEQDFEHQQMVLEAVQMGMTLEEFEKYIEENPNYQDAWNNAVNGTEDYLANIQDHPEFLNVFNLSESEKADLNALFAEEVQPTKKSTQITENDLTKELTAIGDNVGVLSSNEPSTPSLPPSPPNPPSDEDTESQEDSEEAGSNNVIKEGQRLFKKEVKVKAKEEQKKSKYSVMKLAELLYNSQIKAERAIKGLSKYSLASARLRNLKGVTGIINKKLSTIDAQIWGDTDINEKADLDFTIYLLNTIQKEDRRDAKRAKEQERLVSVFENKNKRLPNEKELKAIKYATKQRFPPLSHGNIIWNGKEVPLT
jgi:hypothetical protein